MELTRQSWRSIYEWRLAWREAYELADVGDRSSASYRSWAIKPRVREILDSLPDHRHLWLFSVPAANYMVHTAPRPFSMMATKGKLKIYGDPPTIGLARRSDATLIRLMWDFP